MQEKNKLVYNTGTFFALLFFYHNSALQVKRSGLRLLLAFYLSQKLSNRLGLYYLHCLLEFISKSYISLKYYFLKTIYAFFYNLSFFAYGFWVIFIRFEALLNSVFLGDFTIDFFCYNPLLLTPSIVIPFNRYLLRLDIFSFFFLWSGMEGIRLGFYNNYLKAHPGLWERPYIRHSLTQSWFPRRWCYVPIRGYKVLHLVEFDYRSIRKVMSERFSIMFNYRKYIIVNLIRSNTLYFKQLPLSLEAQWILQKDTTLYWLSALSHKPTFRPMLSFFAPWNWAHNCWLFFSFFMEHPKRFHLDKWRIKRYFYYYLHALGVVPRTAFEFLDKSMRDYSIKHTKKFYNKLFTCNFFQSVFFFEDLYHYNAFCWENLSSFIDRHFCYRVFAMKFNWFFDNYFLESFSPYMNVSFHLQRPFKRKDSSTYALPRRRALVFAQRFLLRFCDLPLYFSYILLGLEYYYWRIYELEANSRCLHNILPFAYYYIKLDIDKLLVSRYRIMVGFFRAFISAHHSSVYTGSQWTYYNLHPAAFVRNRWSEVWQINFFSPWILLHFSALKSIFLQSFNHNFFLTLIAFRLIGLSLCNSVDLELSSIFRKRLRVCLLSVEVIHNYIYTDRLTFIKLPVDWGAPRAKKWLFAFDEKAISTIVIDDRYTINYQWQLENIQKQFLD